MPHHIDTNYRHPAYDDGLMSKPVDHPDRMLFYGSLFATLLWGIIGLLAWAAWKLIS